MSAPSIPNLLSLRGNGVRRGTRNRGGGAGAGAGRGGGLHGSGASRGGHSDDFTIQGTDSDAAVSRLSAVSAGYLDDPYARYFVAAVDGPPPRRFPIINRGTYARTQGIDHLINSFLSQDSSSGGSNGEGAKQIISLGAGTDTRPFRLLQARHHPRLIYHEVDFPAASSKKLRTVEATPHLATVLPNRTAHDSTRWTSQVSSGGGGGGGAEYHNHGIDIRGLSTTTTTEPLLPGLRPDAPTLLLSECCLCYLLPEEAERVIAYFTSRIANLSIVIYEPVHLGDAFGDTMVANLAARGIHMPTLEIFRSLGDQEARLRRAGFEVVRAMTIDGIWDEWIGREEKERLDRLEGLDEVEEWKLLAGHYLVVWGSTGSARPLGVR